MFHIRLRNAAGVALDLAVRESNERRATTAAIRRANESRPNEGWFVQYVLG